MRKLSLLSLLLLLPLSLLFCSVADPATMTDEQILSELESNSRQLSLSLQTANDKILMLNQSLSQSQLNLSKAQSLLTEQAQSLQAQQSSLSAMKTSLQNCEKEIKSQKALNWTITIASGVSVSLLVVLLLVR